MQHLIDSTRVVGTIESAGSRYEVCAEAIGDHGRSDERGGERLTVELRAFLRAASPGHLGETITPDWLPAPQTVRETVSFEEAHELVEDIFATWCRKVAAAIR